MYRDHKIAGTKEREGEGKPQPLRPVAARRESRLDVKSEEVKATIGFDSHASKPTL